MLGCKGLMSSYPLMDKNFKGEMVIPLLVDLITHTRRPKNESAHTETWLFF